MSEAQSLQALELETAAKPDACVIWLHGLGADGHDFEDIVPVLELPEGARVRFVFPHAPKRPVTLNAGMRMRAWFDLNGIGPGHGLDETGIAHSEQGIHQLIAREQSRGVAAGRIVLAGFSQGGAMALYTGLRFAAPLAGLVGLSTWLPFGGPLLSQLPEANRLTPIFLAHGTQDPVVPVPLGESLRDRLREHGYAVQWQAYGMGHSVSLEELRAIGRWLGSVLSL